MDGGGVIFSEEGIAWKKFYGGGFFCMGGTFQRGVSRAGKEYFMEDEPDLPGLFEKRPEIK